MELTVKKADQLKAKPDDSKLGFGTIFTDHMFNMDYNPQEGWHNPRIEPYASINMDPATMVLHYGQGVFEGLKAFRTSSGDVQLFRPKDNFKRMNNSSRLICIPEIDEAFALDALKQLLAVEKDWVPITPGTSLYIRPHHNSYRSLFRCSRFPYPTVFLLFFVLWVPIMPKALILSRYG